VEVFALRRLFARAVKNHFAYFTPSVQREIIAGNSFLRLARGLLDSRRVILVARTRRELIGYAIGATSRSGSAQLFWLYVDPDYRGANTGLSLLSRCLKHLSARGARAVSIATRDYRKYYERQGFKFVKKAVVSGAEMDILTFIFKEHDPK